jgi:hypothetical protein
MSLPGTVKFSNRNATNGAMALPTMFWIAAGGTVLWIALYAVLFTVIDFESDYMSRFQSGGGSDA